MNIKDFSSLTGLSSYTLRYYEKIGLLKNINRSLGGQRLYNHQDKIWIDFVIKLKETGMPLSKIQKDASLREQGKQTVELRQSLLEEHRQLLQAHLAKQQEHLSALDNKIKLYKSGKIC